MNYFLTRLCNRVCGIQIVTVYHTDPHAIHNLAPIYHIYKITNVCLSVTEAVTGN